MAALTSLTTWTGDALGAAWRFVQRVGTIGASSMAARRFRSFGDGSALVFPSGTIYGEAYIEIGERVLIGPGVTLAAGIVPRQSFDHVVVSIGDGVLIGKGSGIVAHERITIGADVFTGHNVYITDANHGYEDLTQPIGAQLAAPRPVSIGAGAWLGHGAIVLPGVTIGEHAVIGAGAVVTRDVPSFSVAVGNPARVIKQYVDGQGWKPV